LRNFAKVGFADRIYLASKFPHPISLMGAISSTGPRAILKEGAMNTRVVRRNRPVLDHVHPYVYMALVGLALWFVLSVWGFAGDGYADYLLAVVSGFIFIVVTLTSTLWWQWWKHRRTDATQEDKESLRAWAAGELDTWQDRVKGSNAAIETLLPIAAVAFGMTAFGIVLHFIAHGAV
jgi:hypothetical protein